MARKWPGGYTLAYWHPSEFKYPELMDPEWMHQIDMLRERCGFPLRNNSDGRTLKDLERIYAKEIAKGQDYPKESSHLFIGDVRVRANDIEPSIPKSGDGCKLNLEERELKLLLEILKMWEEGIWKNLGLGLETGHTHIDDTQRLRDKGRRPAHWVAVSK